MQYFLQDASSPGNLPDGRCVFGAYIKVVQAYDQINEDVKSAVTYKAHVAKKA